MKHRFRDDVLRVVNSNFQPGPGYEIRDEPMLFSSGLDFALRKGGLITRAIIQALPKEAFEVHESRFIVIDTRVHMLMPGFIPAVPGWHCDAWSRETGKPRPEYEHIRHWTATVAENHHLPGTQFLIGDVTLDVDEENVWESVSTQIDRDYPDMGRVESDHGAIYEFGPNQLHRALPSNGTGWRFFFRLSHFWTPPSNEIRKQVQVYTTNHGGW